jgi:ribonuclease G
VNLKIIIVSKELIIRSRSSAVDFALLKDGKLVEFHKEIEDNKFHVGDILLAKFKKNPIWFKCRLCRCRI